MKKSFLMQINKTAIHEMFIQLVASRFLYKSVPFQQIREKIRMHQNRLFLSRRNIKTNLWADLPLGKNYEQMPQA